MNVVVDENCFRYFRILFNREVTKLFAVLYLTADLIWTSPFFGIIPYAD